LIFADSLPTVEGMKLKTQTKTAVVRVGNISVKIYQRQRPTTNGQTRVVFDVADYTTGARRFRGFSDAGDARREAEKIARQLATGETTAATMKNSEAASFGRALELLKPVGISLEVAAANYAKVCALLGGDKVVEAAEFFKRHRADQIETRTTAQVVQELLAAKKAMGKSSRYLADLRARLNRFALDFATDISSITGPDVQRWLEGLSLAPRTAKNFQSCLNTLFAFAESHGYVLKGSNPVSHTDEIDGSSDAAIEIYTPTEIAALLKAAPAEFLPVVAIGAFAGLRSAEIERLSWSDIDLTAGFIEVKAAKAKTRSRRLVPILPNLASWLAPLAAQSGNVWKGTVNSIIEARAKAAKAAGVPWKANGLRHSFVSYRLASTQNASQVSLEAGNSPQMVFRHYRELVKPDAAQAWFAIAPDMAGNIVPIAQAG
jgi:integrase